MGGQKRSCGSSQGPRMTKRDKQRNINIARWNLAGMEMKDASEFPGHTRMEMPWDIICLQEVCRETDKLDCVADYAIFKAAKMMEALRCTG